MDWKNVKIVALDMDGTLLTDDKRITGRTRAAILAAIAEGVIVMAATGRPITGIPPSFREIPGVRYLLGSNGAAVYDQIKECFLVHECIDRETVSAAMKAYRGVDCTFELYIDGIPYIGEEDFKRIGYLIPDLYIREYVKNTRVVVPDLKAFYQKSDGGVEKINMCYPTVAAKDEGVRIAGALPGVDGVCGLPTNLELAKSGVDKGRGLLLLAEKIGVEREAVAACGDSGNDLAMLQKAGIGVAMANSEPQILKAADYILPYSNEQEGIAWLLEQILAQKHK